jgi:sugar lactone lactonase YvrE
MKIYAIPLGADGLASGKPKVIYDFGSENGCDGMCCDAQGNIYLAARSLKRPGVLVIDPTGKEVGFLATGPANQKEVKGVPPVGVPSNVEFGIGDDSKTLYVTVDLSLYRVKLNVPGHHHPFEKSATK